MVRMSLRPICSHESFPATQVVLVDVCEADDQLLNLVADEVPNLIPWEEMATGWDGKGLKQRESNWGPPWDPQF